MLIPKSFQLFGTTYQVKQLPKVIYNGESVLGKYVPDTYTIEIRKNLKKQMKQEVYLHELMHAILLTLQYKKLGWDETFIERTSKALHQAITTSKYE